MDSTKYLTISQLAFAKEHFRVMFSSLKILRISEDILVENIQS